VELDNQDLKTL